MAQDLKEFFLLLFEEREKQLRGRIRLINSRIELLTAITRSEREAAKEALEKSDESTLRQFQQINGLQEQVREQQEFAKEAQQTFITESQLNLKLAVINQKIDSLMESKNQKAGQFEGARWLWAALIGLAMLVVAILAINLK